jgi:hypothetical protein
VVNIPAFLRGERGMDRTYRFEADLSRVAENGETEDDSGERDERRQVLARLEISR